MARKRFDLTDATKKEIFNGGRVAAVTGIAGIGAVYATNYHPGFADYANSILAWGLGGFALSLTIGVLRDFIPQPRQPRQSYGVQAGGNFAESPEKLVALPPTAGDDYVTVNYADGSQQVSRFEAAIPGDFAGAYDGTPRSITMRDVRDMFRKPQPVVAKQLHYPRPVEREAVHFWSNGVQLSGDVVWRFLRYAERNRQKGRGLSERYWTRENRSEWWNPVWYAPMIALLDYASQRSRVQLIILQGNQWRVLARDCKLTYKIIAWACNRGG